MVFVGYDPGRSEPVYRTGWQLWKERNHCYERFVLDYTTPDGVTIMLFRSVDDDGSYVWYIEIDEADLPAGVKRDGVTVRDHRTDP